ncbi:hypothetical protein [Marinitoga sp. 38H-ov]|uniref:hypothetical protein n=1 Tax=Marinitoga sp. 38H-ov TaxID=1755814 RepID=UPI0013EC236D|nr:hypothetical protein [Marinitoga sp. 38H-ov]KAF2955425.1 hypothetical protein AS160_10385 [Marinitoga sp. 38H-ov]
MLKIIEVLGVSWSTGNLIYDYLTGAAWWAWMIDAGFLVAGIVSGGVAALMKQAVKMGLREAIKGLSRKAAILL